MASDNDFYVRYYVGHKGKFGHEFLEFEFRPDGKVRRRNGAPGLRRTILMPDLPRRSSVTPTTRTTRTTR